MTTTQERQLWERLPEETSPAWSAFTEYLHAGAGRSVTRVAAECSKSRSLLNRWSSRHRWVARASAWDAHLAGQYRAEVIDAQRTLAHRHLAVAQAALAKVSAAVNGMDADGLTVPEVVRLWEIAARTEREALQVPTRVHVAGPDGQPIEVAIMTDEERLARLQALRREIDTRLTDHEE